MKEKGDFGNHFERRMTKSDSEAKRPVGRPASGIEINPCIKVSYTACSWVGGQKEEPWMVMSVVVGFLMIPDLWQPFCQHFWIKKTNLLTTDFPQISFWNNEWKMKTQILKPRSTKSTNHSWPCYSNWGPTFSQLSKTDELITKSGQKYKFWNLETQIPQIFCAVIDPHPTFGSRRNEAHFLDIWLHRNICILYAFYTRTYWNNLGVGHLSSSFSKKYWFPNWKI